MDRAPATREMIELIQFPFSPFCIVQRRILEYARVRFKITNIPVGDRSLVWRLTKERYYQVPILRDGRQVLFETDDNSQVIAKYLDQKLNLDLFPTEWRGVQNLLWRHIENEVEAIGFKLNDAQHETFVPRSQRLEFVRHKERKFGRGCLQTWRDQTDEMLARMEAELNPYEQMLMTRDFLLDDRPRFVDFDLFGILGNFLHSGCYEIPEPHTRLREWRHRMARIKLPKSSTTRA